MVLTGADGVHAASPAPPGQKDSPAVDTDAAIEKLWRSSLMSAAAAGGKSTMSTSGSDQSGALRR